MPHYKNGSPAQVGDLVFNTPLSGPRTLGLVLQIQPGAQTCNAQVMPIAKRYEDGAWRQVNTQNLEYITLGESLLAVPEEISVEAKQPESMQEAVAT